MWKPCKLTKKTALMLIQRVIPMSPKLISGPTGNNGAVIFTAPVGPEGLEIKVENDWFTHNGCIKVTVHDTSGGSCLTMYFSPNTFERDYSVDQLEIRFQFEEERLGQGKPINTREFHRALKEKLKECEQP